MTGYFETMGIPIVEGRGFIASDATATGPVAVVNETMVRTFWKDQNPDRPARASGLGRPTPWFTVDRRGERRQAGRRRQEDRHRALFPGGPDGQSGAARQQAPATMNVVLRTTLPAAALSTASSSAVREADPSVPVVRLREMNAVFDESIRRPRLLAQLLGGFAGLALLLAAIGTYGVLSYMVAERRREIGIRMALGADQGRVLAPVMKQGLVLAAHRRRRGAGRRLRAQPGDLVAAVRRAPTDPATMALVVVTIALVAHYGVLAARVARLARGPECRAAKRLEFPPAHEIGPPGRRRPHRRMHQRRHR